MATLKQKTHCERDARDFVVEYGLPEPDRLEYGYTCIRLFWDDPKVVLVIDIDGPDALAEAAAAADATAAEDEEEEIEEDLD
jgi:hypothetical protein